jgi:hypothetical protein
MDLLKTAKARSQEGFAKLEDKLQVLQKQKVALDEFIISLDTSVVTVQDHARKFRFNVGGDKLEISKEALLRALPEWNLLSSGLCSSRWEASTLKDKEGYVYIDSDPSTFQSFLDKLELRSKYLQKHMDIRTLDDSILKEHEDIVSFFRITTCLTMSPPEPNIILGVEENTHIPILRDRHIQDDLYSKVFLQQSKASSEVKLTLRTKYPDENKELQFPKQLTAPYVYFLTVEEKEDDETEEGDDGKEGKAGHVIGVYHYQEHSVLVFEIQNDDVHILDHFHGISRYFEAKTELVSLINTSYRMIYANYHNLQERKITLSYNHILQIYEFSYLNKRTYPFHHLEFYRVEITGGSPGNALLQYPPTANLPFFSNSAAFSSVITLWWENHITMMKVLSDIQAMEEDIKRRVMQLYEEVYFVQEFYQNPSFENVIIPPSLSLTKVSLTDDDHSNEDLDIFPILELIEKSVTDMRLMNGGAMNDEISFTKDPKNTIGERILYIRARGGATVCVLRQSLLLCIAKDNLSDLNEFPASLEGVLLFDSDGYLNLTDFCAKALQHFVQYIRKQSIYVIKSRSRENSPSKRRKSERASISGIMKLTSTKKEIVVPKNVKKEVEKLVKLFQLEDVTILSAKQR